MSINRIVRRNLQRAGEAQHIKGEKVWRKFWVFGVKRLRKVTKKSWIDLRPRDKFGILAGYCSKVAAKIRANEEKKRRLFGDRVSA